MSQLNPAKLHVTRFVTGHERRWEAVDPDRLSVPRVYTLTHSDFSGELFLNIGDKLVKKQISGLYTRLMRDEVWAEWTRAGDLSLRVHCHVSGGLVIGSAAWRYSILNTHMPMVLQAIRYGDRMIFAVQPELDDANIYVCFHSNKKKYDQRIGWGTFRQYILHEIDP